MGNDTQTGAAAGTTEGTAGSSTTTTTETKPGESGASGTTTETKPGEGQAAGDGKTTTSGEQGKETEGKAGATTTPKAPAKYELTVPEDVRANVDEQALAALERTARERDMSNDEAQAFVEDTLSHVRAQAQAWMTETKADPTYGGDKLAETQQLAKRVIDRVRPEGHARRASFLNFIARGGAGNNIEVVSFFADLGRLMGEDSPAHGRTGGAGGDDAATKAARLYDHPDSKAADGRR